MGEPLQGEPLHEEQHQGEHSGQGGEKAQLGEQPEVKQCLGREGQQVQLGEQPEEEQGLGQGGEQEQLEEQPEVEQPQGSSGWPPCAWPAACCAALKFSHATAIGTFTTTFTKNSTKPTVIDHYIVQT